MIKVYDSFLFFNELDLLDIRLRLLDPYVDYFVISECDYTFSGNKKPFYFEENKHLFSNFIHKIIHIKNYNSDNTECLNNILEGKKREILEQISENYEKIKNTQETDFGKKHWCLDYLHREFVSLGFSECDDDDIIIFSDLDEIPNPEVIKKVRELDLENCNYALRQDYHNYYINNITDLEWIGNVIAKYKNIKSDSLSNLRKNRASYNIDDRGGWHWSFVGGIDRVRHKVESWGHQEFNNDNIKSDIENKMEKNSDLFNRSHGFKKVDADVYYPEKIISLIREKYPYLIK